MKHTLLSAVLLALASTAAFADGVGKEEIKKLIGAGVGDDVVIAFIRANGGMDPLSADDVVELKKLGATDKLLAAVLGDKTPGATPSPEGDPPVSAAPVQRETVYVPQAVYVERPVYVPQPTYYTPVYYRYPSYSYSYVNCAPRYTHSYSYNPFTCAPRYYSRASYGGSYGARYSRRGGVSVGFGVRW